MENGLKTILFLNYFDVSNSDNEEVEDLQIQSSITSKEEKRKATLALKTFHKYIDRNKGMYDLFKPLGTWFLEIIILIIMY